MASYDDFKSLGKKELIDKLVEKTNQVAELEAKLKDAEDTINSNRIELEEAGSIAEASIRINGVFEAAQKAADQYLENIKSLSAKQETICERREVESMEKAVKLLEETAAKCHKLEEDTQNKCNKMVSEAKKESEGYWTTLSEKLDAFYNEHKGLKELLDFSSKIMGKAEAESAKEEPIEAEPAGKE